MPFLRWAGGKTKLLKYIIPIISCFIDESKSNVYFEPFLGSGAVLIELLKNGIRFDKYICSDLNRNLIITFNQIKQNHEELIKEMEKLQTDFNLIDDESKAQFYYDKRNEYNNIIDSDQELQIASLFIFLNKTSFRGLYRVNKDGEYNIPFGNHTNRTLIKPQYIRELNKLFTDYDVIFNHDSYESVLENLNEESNNIVYLDPPYFGTFDNYTKEQFIHSRFVGFLEELFKRNMKMVLSNSIQFKPRLENLGIFKTIQTIEIQDRMNSRHPEKKRLEILAY